jgi:hypothetical protein
MDKRKRPHTAEHNRKIGLAQLGNKNHGFGKPAWNKGLKGVQIHTPEMNKRMSEIKKEWYAMHPERRTAISKEMSGSNHPRWKGGRDNRVREKFAPRPRPLHCEVCGSSGRICLDHDHETNQFKGWLCDRCNVAVAMARDNPEILRALADYVERVSKSGLIDSLITP